MRFIELKEFGEAEVMTIGEGEVPAVKDGEVLIAVVAAGVNRPDVAQRRGLYPPPPGASAIMGLEVSGRVSAVGSGVEPSLLGTDVCALVNGGGYAEFVTVPASQCLPIPDGLTLIEAAAIPETFFTVWTNVFDRAQLKAGETFLVHGGSSGIGSTAIQLAKAMGARVFTTAGNEDKCEFCRQLGAEVAVNYREQDFVSELQQATDGRGVDVILDMVGGDYVMRNIQLAAMDGRIVNIAFLGGSQVNINLAPAMIKRLTLTGSTLRPRTTEDKAKIAASLREQVWPLLANGTIKPRIAKVFPFGQVVQAHRLMESSAHMGKIVLDLGAKK